MYTVEQRAATSDRVLEIARSDDRIVAGAVVGSLAEGGGDRWSDIDLTFAVDEGAKLQDVLAEWTAIFAEQLDATMLFDLPSGATIYRVFFLPGGLQLDVSVTPASRFAPGGPRFRLLFGEEGTPPEETWTFPAPETFGWGVAYAREARACIERERPWQAEHSIDALRDHGLMLACARRDLPTAYGRGYDDLPADVLSRFESARASSLERGDLLGALRTGVEGLIAESEDAGDAARKVAPHLIDLVTAPS